VQEDLTGRREACHLHGWIRRGRRFALFAASGTTLSIDLLRDPLLGLLSQGGSGLLELIRRPVTQDCMEAMVIGPIESAFETMEYHVDHFGRECDRFAITY